MNRHSRCKFFSARHSVGVEADAVSHKSGQNKSFVTRAIFGVAGPRVCGGFDGGPRRRPKWVDAGASVRNFRDMAALTQNRNANGFIFDASRSTISVEYFGHCASGSELRL